VEIVERLDLIILS